MCAVLFHTTYYRTFTVGQLSKPNNALIFIVSISQSLSEISWSSVSSLEINLPFSKDVMLLLSTTSFRTFVGKIKGILFNDEFEHVTCYPSGSYQHFSGHTFVTLAGRITNHNQNITTVVASSIDTKFTVSFDGMANCCNLHRERNWFWMLMCFF